MNLRTYLCKYYKLNIMIKKLLNIITFFKQNRANVIKNYKELKWFYYDFKTFKNQLGNNNDFTFGKWFPIFDEKHVDSGTAKGHYFHQDLLVAKKIFKNNPIKHVDIGSRIDGFVAHVAVFREIEVFDIRPLDNKINNIKFIKKDAMNNNDLHSEYTDSISSLHAIEHFGLGRYNDTIDAFGHIKGLEMIYSTLKKGGYFYFSVPIGKQRIEFNAHRVFSLLYLVKLFENKYTINSFSYVDDKGDLHVNINLTDILIKENCNCNYGCGIFELIKL